MASGFKSFAFIKKIKDIWYSFGGLRSKEKCIKILARGSETNCFASANDWVNENENNNSNYRQKPWTKQPSTEKQLKFIIKELEKEKNSSVINADELKKLNKYHSSVVISYLINKKAIEKAHFILKNQQSFNLN